MDVETPLVKTTGKTIPKNVCLVPVLRAGLGMVDAMLSLLPAARVGHIGLYRDHETLHPVEYYCKMPLDVSERVCIILDPMLATGGSSVAAIDSLKRRGVKTIKLVQTVHDAHPDVPIYLGCMDERLNENGYILPGLGDAGDRLYGTK